MNLISYNRKIDYLRLSITDKCDLRCRYCMPAEGVKSKEHHQLMRVEEMYRLITLFNQYGVTKLRITGGEPLVSKLLFPLLKNIRQLQLQDIALTTNAQLLAPMVNDLKKAGVNRLNISLDTLKPDRFTWITRGGDLQKTLDGIDAALQYGLNPVKINVVAIKGFNDDEFLDLALLAKDRPLHIRFIELMPVGENIWGPQNFISKQEILDLTASLGKLLPTKVKGNGPADIFQIQDFCGTIGFINAISGHFCDRCNRMRLTSDGKLYPCLHNDYFVDLLKPMREGASDDLLLSLILSGAENKPMQHNLGAQSRNMNTIGG